MIKNIITSSGKHGSFRVRNGDRDSDLGVLVNLNKGKTAFIDTIDCSDVFVPFTFVGEGRVVIDTIMGTKYGGDLIDLWGMWGSHVVIRHIYGFDDRPTRPYKKYHPDVVQVENLGRTFTPNSGASGQIYLPDIDVEVSGTSTQGVTMSGKTRNTHVEIGSSRLHLNFPKPKKGRSGKKVLNAYQIDNSIIGGSEVKTNGEIYVAPRGNKFDHFSYNNEFIGVDINPLSELR